MTAALGAPTAAPQGAGTGAVTVAAVRAAPTDNRRVPLYAPSTPLVGRRDDLARLRGVLGLPDRGGIALLAGDAGIGKSRLLAAVAQELAEQGCLVVAGYCVGLGGAAPAYLPFTDLIGEVAAAEPDLVAGVASAHPALARLLPEQPPAAPDVLATPAAPDVPPDPARMAAAVHACLEAVARRRPLLAVVEDVHWADNSSRDLLSVLFTRGFAGPVGLVASYRSDDLHRRHPLHETLGAWARLPRVGRHNVGALPEADMRALVASLADAPRDPAVVADVVARADGNAFFAEELVAGGATVTGDLGRVLWLRVESLGEDARTAVRTMAVGGRQVAAELLGAVTDLSPAALDAALREAMDRQLVVRLDGDFAFRHALLAETSYDDLLPAERTRLHAAYAAALLARPDLGSAADLARHAWAAGERDAAIEAAVRAGQEAMEVGGPADGLAHYERALSWMGVDHPERDAVTEAASGAASAAGNTLRAFALLKDRIDHPGQDQGPQRRAGLLALLALKARVLDAPFDALGATAEAIALLPAEAPPRLQCRVRLARLQALVDDLRYAESVALADEISQLAEAHELPRVATEARAILGRVIEAEKDTAAMGAHLEAVRAELAGTDDAVLVRVCHNLAGVYHRGGDLVRARELLAEGRAVAERRQRPWAPWATECRLLEAVYSFELGEWQRAQALLTIPPTVTELSQAMLSSAALVLRVARGEEVTEAELGALGRWWPYDGLVAHLTCVGGVEALATAGDPAGAVRLLLAGTDVLDRLWGSSYQAIVRLTAAAAGACAGAGADLDGPARAHVVEVLAPLVLRARERVARGDHYVGAESLAWAARLEADWARLLRRWGVAAQTGASGAQASGEEACGAEAEADEVAAWRRAVARMGEYGHVYETARSRARLAEALLARAEPGDDVEAGAEWRAAHADALRLGAGNLLGELGRSVGSAGEAPSPGVADGATKAAATPAASATPDAPATPDAAAAPATPEAAGAPKPTGGAKADDAPGPGEAHLTPRELEVLRRLALGHTNGQIGRELYISTKTASVHVSNILAKLGTPTRGAAAAEGARRGLV